MNEPVKFTHENKTYIIYPSDKTWDQSRIHCQERGSILAYLNDLAVANLMVGAMADHPKGKYNKSQV